MPVPADLTEKLGDSYPLWQKISQYVHLKYPGAEDEWLYSGDKYGWGMRIKVRKRAILYLLPRDRFFKVAFVFGQKATELIMKSRVSDLIKSELDSARVYAEGRGTRIEITNDSQVPDICMLVDYK